MLVILEKGVERKREKYFQMDARHASDPSPGIQINVIPRLKQGEQGTVPSAGQYDDPHKRKDQGSSEHSDTRQGKVDQTEVKEPFFFVKWVANRPRLSFGKSTHLQGKEIKRKFGG